MNEVASLNKALIEGGTGCSVSDNGSHDTVTLHRPGNPDVTIDKTTRPFDLVQFCLSTAGRVMQPQGSADGDTCGGGGESFLGALGRFGAMVLVGGFAGAIGGDAGHDVYRGVKDVFTSDS